MHATRRLLAVALATAALGAPPGALPLEAQAPEFSDVAGHEIGERITLHHQAVAYLERVAAASDRVRLVEQGRSWEGRPLVAAVVTSPANHAREEAIREAASDLADPRGVSPGRVDSLVEEQPVVVWLGGSIHGDEISGAEALLQLLERLATADDPETTRVLEEAVVVVDPILNPDGRDAFARTIRERSGAEPNPDPRDWSNDFTAWQDTRYRTGHYFFDTNRDWFASTQRETRQRIPTLRRWHPQVVVDAHEMGPGAEFYFDPPADPYSPYYPEYSRQGFEDFNAAYSAAFDTAGYEYMTRERYNYFYPGYTDSYNTYQGAVGMLFEQGTSAGLALERPDGSVRTLRDAVDHQYLALWTAARSAVERRGQMLRDYVDARRAAVADGREGVRRYLIAPGGDPGLRADAVRLLDRHGIEVRELTEPVRLEGVRDRRGRSVGAREFEAGTYVVEAAQPMNRLVRTLLEPDVPVPEDFLREARERVERDESAGFYDITSWSLPLLYDLRGFSSTDGRELPARSAEAPGAGGGVAAASDWERADYAYAVDGRAAASVSVLSGLMERGHRAGMLLEPTRIGGGEIAAGSMIVMVGENDESVHADLRELAGRHGVGVRALGSGLAEPGGPSLGTGDLVRVREPDVALLAEGPVEGYSFGWAWHALDRQYEIPHTSLRVGEVGSTPIGDLDALVVPDLSSAAALSEALGEEGTGRLTRWVRDGGTLVVVGEGVEFAREELGLLELRSWYEEASGEAGDAESSADDRPYRFRVPGAIFAGRVDRDWWLSAGSPAELPVLVASDRIYLPPEGPPDQGERTVVRYAPGDSLHLSGHAWPESVRRAGGGAVVYEERVGAGRVIAFAEDPSFRGFWRGADRLFLNAVVVGPSAP